jgi:hypothetical protein
LLRFRPKRHSPREPARFASDSGVGGAGVDEGQARVNTFVVIAPCPRRHPQPDVVLLKSHRGFVVEASLRLGPGPRLGSEGVHRTVDLVVVLTESTNDNMAETQRPRPGSQRGQDAEEREGMYPNKQINLIQ